VVHTLPLSGNFEQYPLKIAIKEPAALIAYPLKFRLPPDTAFYWEVVI